MRAQIPLYLFAKAPVVGLVKRRMCPPLNEVQATQVAIALLAHASKVLEQSWPGQCILSVAPDLSHSAFANHQQSDRWQTQVQPNTDLGGRMRQALLEGIKKAGCAAVLGSDIPTINAKILHQAYASLASGRQVVGPSVDGGFYLLGLRQIPEALFNNINWGSSDEVYTKLSANAQTCDLKLEALPSLPDCDYYADLQKAVRQSGEFAQALLQTGFDLAVLEKSQQD